MTIATENPTVERYRRMVDIIDNCPSEDAYNILKDHAHRDCSYYYELVVSRSAVYSYLYARDVNKGWLAGEEAISQDAEYSYRYARDVIHGRWEPGEEAISRNKEMLADYAFEVIKGRLPDHLEKILLSDEVTL